MPLGQTTYCRITGHGPYGIGINNTDQGLAAHSGGGKSGFTARMSGPYDSYIKISHGFFYRYYV
jgi:hypothetical protein